MEKFFGTVAKNGQLTVKSSVRKALSIETGDIVFCTITRVITPDGRIKYDIDEEEEESIQYDLEQERGEEKWEQ